MSTIDGTTYGLTATHEVICTESGDIACLAVCYEHDLIDGATESIRVVDVQVRWLEVDSGKPEFLTLEEQRFADGFWRTLHGRSKGFQAECELAAWAHWRKTGGQREAA
jgi:hypothetical protein